jgi:monofunctional biosynthetic peptidoglycan transglycosylase
MRRLALRLAVVVLAATALPVLALRWMPPLTSSFMLRRALGLDGHAVCPEIEYDWVGWDAISPAAKLAAVAAEDQRFAQHLGFDFESIRDAVEEQRNGGRRRGASTISQQVAKNLFLWPGRSFVRKGLEAWLTVWIEALWPKRRILEVYLNVAQFGPCTFGVEAAAQGFFGRSASRLAPEQAALLAAALPNPLALRVDAPSAGLHRRALRVRAQAARLGGGAWLDTLE